MRDAGYADPEQWEILRNRGEVEGEGDDLDYYGEPTDQQKEYALDQYRQLADAMNAKAQDGRTDWAEREAWGVSRAATAIHFGFDADDTERIVPWPSQTDDAW